MTNPDDIVAKLNEANRILTEEIEKPDMDVAEWRRTPIGRATSAISDAIDMLLEE
jgi:hypothetical protein